MTRDVGLYFHIPFCVRKCAYCDFVSWPGMEDAMRRIGMEIPEYLRV